MPPTLSFQLQNIQQRRDGTSLSELIVQGLLSTPLKLPSLLLWDDDGLRLFDALTQTPTYYLHDKEVEILAQYANDMAARIPSGSVLIELGCGSLRKTGAILSALERKNKAIDYYALDVSPGELSDSLATLTARLGPSSGVKVHGLVGTYEDCISWLAGNPWPQKQVDLVTLLWMGNSVANHGQLEASSVLGQFARAVQGAGVPCQFLVAVDACQKESRVLEAYDSDQEALREFILNGLRHANTIMGRQMFNSDEWDCVCRFDAHDHTLRVYYTCRMDTELTVDGHRLSLANGSQIEAITSGKWTVGDVQQIAKRAGLRVKDRWCDAECIYCETTICPTLLFDTNRGRLLYNDCRLSLL
ncbi:unnamed protein product [Clonostachys byssicola]|uniref:Histidine-specific methyltransferase SAM-dependent domain-containing protein n=1 Tax=Clonostachys byssicola TaxID=160290 RepID=A0A9N9UER6_9HYPO|nr:unnamed protein product [Clonostachys byssicola]